MEDSERNDIKDNDLQLLMNTVGFCLGILAGASITVLILITIDK